MKIVGVVKQTLAWSGDTGREMKNRWERSHVHHAADEPSYSLTNVCPSSKYHSIASHHLKPCSITNTNWSVWLFTTFPCLVFCTYFLKCASKIGDGKTQASLWWKGWCEDTPGKQQCLIFISTQNKFAQRWKW